MRMKNGIGQGNNEKEKKMIESHQQFTATNSSLNFLYSKPSS